MCPGGSAHFGTAMQLYGGGPSPRVPSLIPSFRTATGHEAVAGGADGTPLGTAMLTVSPVAQHLALFIWCLILGPYSVELCLHPVPAAPFSRVPASPAERSAHLRPDTACSLPLLSPPSLGILWGCLSFPVLLCRPQPLACHGVGTVPGHVPPEPGSVGPHPQVGLCTGTKPFGISQLCLMPLWCRAHCGAMPLVPFGALGAGRGAVCSCPVSHLHPCPLSRCRGVIFAEECAVPSDSRGL